MIDTKPARRMVYFSHNRRDTAFVRRVQGFVKAGVAITTFSFRRDGEPVSPGPAWSNVDLGHLEHGRFAQRAVLYLKALYAVFANRRAIARADVVYARNLDIFLFAYLAVRLSAPWRSRGVTFVYECLDVHEALIGANWKARVLRYLERRVLAISRLLVVSSPGFMEHFFVPVQRYAGPHHWIENKLYFGSADVPRDAGVRPRQDAPLTIGWVGIIRCVKTLELLIALARAKPDDVVIRISGLVSYFLLPDFDEQIADVPNIRFEGPYDWPQGLARAYAGVDIVWSQELAWSGGNSDWLIPNRVYEASYFGVPSLSVGATQTSSIVRERKLGYVLSEPTSSALLAFIEQLDRAQLAAMQADLLARPKAQFVLQADDTDALLAAIDQAR